MFLQSGREVDDKQDGYEGKQAKPDVPGYGIIDKETNKHCRNHYAQA